MSIRLIQVSTLLGNASGNAFTISIKKVKVTTPAPIIIAIFIKGYFPIKTSIKTIENIKAVVEKLAGKIRIKVTKTGAQRSNKDFLKVIFSISVLERYRATNINKEMEAKADGWKVIPINGT